MLTFRPSSPSLRQIAGQSLTALALVAACGSALAADPPFTLDPAASGLAGSAVTADNIKVADYASVSFTNAAKTAFTETGFLRVSSMEYLGSSASATGLNTGGYGLYFQFNGTGTLTAGGDPATTPTLGSFDTLTYSLYGYNGSPATFSISGNAPTKTATTDVLLASGSLISGSLSTAPAGGGQFSPSANVKMSFDVAPGQAGFFADPTPFYNLAFAAFTNTPGQVKAFGDGFGGFTIEAGGGTVNFASAVPEPQTYAMLLAGICAVGLMSRRRLS